MYWNRVLAQRRKRSFSSAASWASCADSSGSVMTRRLSTVPTGPSLACIVVGSVAMPRYGAGVSFDGLMIAPPGMSRRAWVGARP